MDIWTFGLLIAVGLLFTGRYLRERRRSAAIQGVAIRIGFNFLGRGVPRSLRLYGTPMERATSIWNVIDGDRPGIRIIAFDCQMGAGKGAWRRTVIAVRTDNDSAFASDCDLRVEHSSDSV